MWQDCLPEEICRSWKHQKLCRCVQMTQLWNSKPCVGAPQTHSIHLLSPYVLIIQNLPVLWMQMICTCLEWWIWNSMEYPFWSWSLELHIAPGTRKVFSKIACESENEAVTELVTHFLMSSENLKIVSALYCFNFYWYWLLMMTNQNALLLLWISSSFL